MQGAKCQGPEAMEEGWGSGSTQLFIKIIDTLCAHGRSQTSYIALCNDVVSHGAQIGGLRVLADYTRKKQTQYKGVHDLCTPCGILCVFMQVTNATDEPRLFW